MNIDEVMVVIMIYVLNTIYHIKVNILNLA